MTTVRCKSRLANGLALVLLASALALTGLLVASGWYSFAWKGQKQWASWGLEGGHGSLRLMHRPQHPDRPGLEITREPFELNWRSRGLYVRHNYIVYSHGVHMHYGWNEEWEEFFIWPLPLAALALAAACRWLARRAARRIAHGCCPACNYDLKGIAPDIPCPECGHAPPMIPTYS